MQNRFNSAPANILTKAEKELQQLSKPVLTYKRGSLCNVSLMPQPHTPAKVYIQPKLKSLDKTVPKLKCRLLVSQSQASHRSFLRKAGKCASYILNKVGTLLKQEAGNYGDGVGRRWVNMPHWIGETQALQEPAGVGLLPEWNLHNLPETMHTLNTFFATTDKQIHI